MTPIQKALLAIFAAISTVGGAVWTCLAIIDRNDSRVRERAKMELTVQGIQKDYEALNSREWQHWDQLNVESKALRQELVGIREKLLTLELKPK